MYLRWKKIMRVILFDLLTFKWYSWLSDISVSIFQHSWWRKLRNVEGPNAPKRSYFVVWCVSLDWPADHPPSSLSCGGQLDADTDQVTSIHYTHLTFTNFTILYPFNTRIHIGLSAQCSSAPRRRLFLRCEATTLNFQTICVICYLFKEADVCHPKYVVTSVLTTVEMAPADLPTQCQWCHWWSCSGL